MSTTTTSTPGGLRRRQTTYLLVVILAAALGALAALGVQWLGGDRSRGHVHRGGRHVPVGRVGPVRAAGWGRRRPLRPAGGGDG